MDTIETRQRNQVGVFRPKRGATCAVAARGWGDSV